MPETSKVIEFGKTNPAVLSAPSSDVAPIEFGGPGGGFLERAGASIPTTTEGKVSFLERIYGPGNVKTTPAGEILVPVDLNNPAAGLQPFDERSITFRDVTADIVGPAIEAVPGAVGGVVGFGAGSIPGAAAGGAIGTAGRIGLSEVLTGGNTGQTRGEQLFDIGLSALFSAGAQGVANLGAKVFDALRPGNFVARSVKKAEAKPFAKKGGRLSEQTGIPFTLGEETGSRGMLQVEALGRRTPGAADMFFNFHQGQLRTAMGRLERAMEKVRPGQVGTFEAGSQITTAFDDAVKSAMDLRTAQAAADFGRVNALSSGQPIVPARNTLVEMQQLIDELDVPGAGDATSKLLSQIKASRDGLIAPEGEIQALAAEKVQRLLQLYTAAQQGTKPLYRDLDKAQTRWIAGRLKDALMRDLDAAAESGAGEIVTALKAARDRYRVNSEAIRSIADSTLSRLIGNGTRSPEAIAEAFVSRFKPSEVRTAMEIIEKASPEAAQSVRRVFIERAIDNAKPAISQQTAEGVKFSASKFVSNLPDMETMKAAGFSRQEIGEIGQLSKALQRVADKAYEGSPTAFAGIAWDAIQGVFTLNPITIGRSAAAVLTPRKIGKAVLTPEGRQALRTLATSKPESKAAIQAAINLTAITASEPGAEDVRPLGPMRDDTTTLDEELER